ncbi:diguanylate cyclase [Massilia sp. Root418]|jgi:diguanylate cyclase (GGDEF)-like protein|uniref:sensor domain-containing diguanylate cyclase n=1 Tax=Massilia sp. Root418 TaxID=1736532 RepID=UPI0007015D42|nr:sensor domain-containing diguanylate cyclase [Massilia sp. Root418]KQW96902.1 diguanylate cyclase [Massilia sp. Root418]
MDLEANRLGLLESVLGAVHVGAIVLDGAGRIVLWNRWMEQYSAMPAGDVLCRDFYALFPEMRSQRIGMAIQQALASNFPSLLSQTLNKSPFPLHADHAAAARGERLQQAIAVTPVALAGAERHCLIQITDVSIAANREKVLREQAMVLRSQTFSDGLTGVANRRHFDVAIDKEQRRAKRNNASLSLLMIDIDCFKAYNDHYGHQQGDQCLIQVSAALAAMLHRSTDLLARYGGEEFAIILPDTDADQAMLMAEALRQRVLALAIEHRCAAEGRQHVTVSVGLATLSPQQPFDVPALIGAADRALYAAKHAGRNRVAAHQHEVCDR